MSIFGSIMSKIFHHGNEAQAAPSTQTADASPASPAPAAPSPGTSAPTPTPSASTDTVPGAGTTQTAPTPAGQPVDVAAVLDGLAAKNSQKLDWRHSIVDMMKLLDLDSGLAARKSLAAELHYSGSTDDSATMNIWLHKQVMDKLAANGGQVPADLRS